jgi:hypothetical protein
MAQRKRDPALKDFMDAMMASTNPAVRSAEDWYIPPDKYLRFDPTVVDSAARAGFVAIKREQEHRGVIRKAVLTDHGRDPLTLGLLAAGYVFEARTWWAMRNPPSSDGPHHSVRAPISREDASVVVDEILVGRLSGFDLPWWIQECPRLKKGGG